MPDLKKLSDALWDIALTPLEGLIGNARAEAQQVAAEAKLRGASELWDAVTRPEYEAWQDEVNAKVPDTMPKDKGRLVVYKTGVASLGFEEETSEYLCWECDESSWRDGLCHEHWYAMQAQDELAALEEWTEGAYAAEELERMQQLEDERRNDL